MMRAIGAALALSFGVGAAVYPGPEAAARVEILRAEVLPVSGPTAQLRVELDAPASVQVEYRTGNEDPLVLEGTESTRTHALTLARLLPDSEYRFLVRTRGDSVEGRFTSAPLPLSLEELRLESTGGPSAPLTALEISHPTRFSGPVVVDAAGRIVWYHPTQGDAHGFLRRTGGTFVILDVERGLIEVTPAGEVLATLENTDERWIHHDVQETRDGRLIFLAREWRHVEGDSIRGESIWRWEPESGMVERLWSAFDHLDPARDRGVRSRNANWLHANSVSEDYAGNLLVSLAFLDQVVSIAPDGSEIAWRLGGPGATYQPGGEPFSGQHTATAVGPDRVLLFDNGYDRSAPPRYEGAYSRAVEYELRDGGARLVWQFRSPNDTWSRVVGGAQRLGNGNTLVTFGANPGLRGSRGGIEVFEVAPDGEIAWRLAVAGPVRTLYRATALETIAGEVLGGTEH